MEGVTILSKRLGGERNMFTDFAFKPFTAIFTDHPKALRIEQQFLTYLLTELSPS
jgi:hypothetical protein